MKEKTAFLLLAFGGADSVENVEPFIKNVLKGKPVTPEMVEKLKERYKLIGGKSPLLETTKAQAAGLEAILRKNGLDYKGYVGMRYWHPFIKDTLKEMKEDGVEKAIAVIMAPFATRVSCGGYVTDIHEASSALGGVPRVELSQFWNLKHPFIEAVADNLKAELAHFEKKEDVLVIFSNHSLPLALLEGDPYEMIVNQTAAEVMKKLPCEYKVSYQSKGAGPREWMGPSTEEVIEQAKKSGKKGVVVVPLGFVADHVETLYDIDILFKGLAESLGLAFRRSASLNTSAKFLEAVSSVIISHFERTSL